jgi:Zn finger protein HypA/HybF involved in hydrogenase expression
MCFADTSVSVDIDPDDIVANQYRCTDCKTTFKGLGKKICCPSCQSTNVKKI